jgi:hypothetical protein
VRVNIPHQNRLPFSLFLSFGQPKERKAAESDQASVLLPLRNNQKDLSCEE